MSDTPEPGAPLAAPVSTPVRVQFGSGDGPSGLDYLLILGALGLLGYGMHGLMGGKVSAAVLPTIASLLSFIAGTVLGGYAGYRWGSSAGSKTANAALAKLAGAQ